MSPLTKDLIGDALWLAAVIALVLLAGEVVPILAEILRGAS